MKIKKKKYMHQNKLLASKLLDWGSAIKSAGLLAPSRKFSRKSTCFVMKNLHFFDQEFSKFWKEIGTNRGTLCFLPNFRVLGEGSPDAALALKWHVFLAQAPKFQWENIQQSHIFFSEKILFMFILLPSLWLNFFTSLSLASLGSHLGRTVIISWYTHVLINDLIFSTLIWNLHIWPRFYNRLSPLSQRETLQQ